MVLGPLGELGLRDCGQFTQDNNGRRRERRYGWRRNTICCSARPSVTCRVSGISLPSRLKKHSEKEGKQQSTFERTCRKKKGKQKASRWKKTSKHSYIHNAKYLVRNSTCIAESTSTQGTGTTHELWHTIQYHRQPNTARKISMVRTPEKKEE